MKVALIGDSVKIYPKPERIGKEKISEKFRSRYQYRYHHLRFVPKIQIQKIHA